MDPATTAALIAALPAVLELGTLLAKAIAGQAVDPAAIKAAELNARTATAAALVALEASHAAARAAADAALAQVP